MTGKKIPKIAIVVSHPIQHFCPQYVSYAKCKDWEVMVFFASALGSTPYKDIQFGETIQWPNLYLDLFNHKFLNKEEVIKISPSIDSSELELNLEQYAPDVVITYGYIQKVQRRAVKWAKKNNKKIFYISDSEYAQRTNYLKEYLKRLILKNYFNKIDLFFTVGNFNEHYYAWHGIKMEKMIRTGFPVDYTILERCYNERLIRRNYIRNLLNINNKHIVVSVIGKILDFKRQEDLIHALYEIEKISEIQLTAIIIGSGPSMLKIKQLSEKLYFNKVIFTGFLSPENLPDYLAASDIYIHPSSKDRHSLSITEAVYMGCPVIISNLCGSHGPTDDVQIGKNGFVYDCGDIDQLIKTLLVLGQNPRLRETFSEFSHDFAIKTQALAHGEGLRAALLTCGLL